jgi:transcriptional regulator with XRE-family HTH domain
MAEGRTDWIGLRVARWRDIAGMTQQQLADAIGVTRQYVSMIENGQRAVTKRSLLYDLAGALQVNVTDLTGQPVPPRGSAERALSVIAPVIRCALDGFDAPPAPPRSIEHLSDGVAWASSARMNGDFRTFGDVMPNVLAETAVLAEEGDEQGTAMHIRALFAAGLELRVLGMVDLARRAAERAGYYADKLHDPVHLGAAAYVTAQTVLTGGSRHRSLEIAERAADRLQQDATCEDARMLYGMLHLHAALSAASVDQHDKAEAHLGEAADYALTMTGDPWWMDFGPDNVGVWRVSVALENGDPERAPALARGVDPMGLRHSTRRVRLYADVGRGHFAAGDHAEATRAFLAADTAGHLRFITFPECREVVGQMLRDSRARGGSEELRDLAARMGLDPLEPPDAGVA